MNRNQQFRTPNKNFGNNFKPRNTFNKSKILPKSEPMSMQTTRSRPQRELFNNFEEQESSLSHNNYQEQESSLSRNNQITDESEEQNSFLGLGSYELEKNS